MKQPLEKLAEFDVSASASGILPPLLVRLGFGLVCTGMLVVARALIDYAAPMAGSFALIYPVVLIATLFGRWEGGLVTYATGLSWTWIYVLPRTTMFELAKPGDGPRTIVNAITLLLILAFAEVFRRAVRRASAQRDHALQESSMREAQLRELNATLEQRVTDEVAEREQTQAALRQSQKMEALGQLTGGVAHDFNNLLTPIVGTLDLLSRRESATEREKRLLDGAIQSADRATTLVQRLLAFARRQQLKPGAIDTAALIAGMADLVSHTLGPQIRVVVDTPRDLPPALADANQLEMAILNLCVNARDAMPDGGVLTIAAGAEVPPEDEGAPLANRRYIRLIVADTGIGMDPATLKRAIEPFFSTKGIGKGTGLGLSMVHGLAAQLGGRLDIHSQLGLGTRIELWLPVSDDAVKLAEVEPVSIKEVARRGRALVVDDDDAVRAITAEMLNDLGYETVELAGAYEAQALLMDGEPIDVVVTDHLMPGMTGAELARAVHQIRPELPVLLVSGYANVAEIASDMPRLSKPFRQDDLRRALADLN